MNFWDKPMVADTWEQDLDYAMFIDENNSISSFNIVKEKLLNRKEISPNENIFTVTGCIFSRNDYIEAREEFDKLRNKYWTNGMYFDSKKNQKLMVCFHSEDIRGRKKAFHKSILNDDEYNNFIIDLDNILNKLNFKIISINFDLASYIINSKYDEPNVYKIAFNFILERYIYNIGFYNKGYIIFEARGKKEDKTLLNHINQIINNTGTEYVKSPELQKKISGIYFNSKKNKKGHPYTGLEIADLCSYPIHRLVKFESGGRDLDTIKHKIIGYPNCKGKGLKIYPKK